MRLETFLKFKILVPKRMCKKVEANAASSPLEKSRCGMLAWISRVGMGATPKGEAEGSKHGVFI